MTPFAKRFTAVALEKSYRQISPVLRTIYLNVVYLKNFCWWKVMYRVLIAPFVERVKTATLGMSF